MDMAVTDRRERILQAVAVLVVRSGMQCSMADVAREAGVAIGSIYHYFPSKDEMIAALYQRVQTRIMAALVIDHPADLPHAARVQRYIDDYIALIVAEPDFAILFEYLSSIPQLEPGSLAKRFEDVNRFTNRLMTEASAAGVLKPFAAPDLGAFIGGGIRNTLKWRRAAGQPVSTEDRRHIADMVWAAIRA